MSALPVPDERANAELTQRIRSAALDYAAHGQPVFPCMPADVLNDDGTMREAKSPMTRNGLNGATTDRDQIEQWWDRWPHAAIGLTTGHQFDVIDMDVKPGRADGRVAVAFLNSTRLLDGIIRAVRTPSGGAHLYFPANHDDPMVNAAWEKVGVDLRGVGGYVIAASSYVQTEDYSGCYEVVAEYPGNGFPLDWRGVRRLLMGEPRDISAQSAPPRRGGGEALARFVASARPGERNHVLFWAACRAVEQHLDTDPLVAAALDTGLPQSEVDRTIRSAMMTAVVL